MLCNSSNINLIKLRSQSLTHLDLNFFATSLTMPRLHSSSDDVASGPGSPLKFNLLRVFLFCQKNFFQTYKIWADNPQFWGSLDQS